VIKNSPVLSPDGAIFRWLVQCPITVRVYRVRKFVKTLFMLENFPRNYPMMTFHCPVMVSFRQAGEIGTVQCGRNAGEIWRNPYWRNQLGCATGTEEILRVGQFGPRVGPFWPRVGQFFDRKFASVIPLSNPRPRLTPVILCRAKPPAPYPLKWTQGGHCISELQ
jgi:hypothetical protein